MPTIVYQPEREYPPRKGARYINRQHLEPGKNIPVSKEFLDSPQVKQFLEWNAIVVLAEEKPEETIQEFITEPVVTEIKPKKNKRRSEVDELGEIGKNNIQTLGEIS